MKELKMSDIKVYCSPVRFAVYSGKELLYVGFSRMPLAYIHKSVANGYWNKLSQHKDVRFVIDLPDDFNEQPLYTSLHEKGDK